MKKIKKGNKVKIVKCMFGKHDGRIGVIEEDVLPFYVKTGEHIGDYCVAKEVVVLEA